MKLSNIIKLFISISSIIIFTACTEDEKKTEPTPQPLSSITFDELKEGGYIIRRGVIGVGNSITVQRDIYCHNRIFKSINETTSFGKIGTYTIPNQGNSNDNIISQNIDTPVAEIILLPFEIDRVIRSGVFYKFTSTPNNTVARDYKIIEIVKNTQSHCK